MFGTIVFMRRAKQEQISLFSGAVNFKNHGFQYMAQVVLEFKAVSKVDMLPLPMF